MSCQFQTIDAHVHLWDVALLDYPWLRTETALDQTFLPADLRLASAGVDVAGWVFVEAGCRADQGHAEARWVEGLARAGAPVVGIVAALAVEDGQRCVADLEALLEISLVSGVRRNAQDEAAGFLLQPGLVEGVRRVGARGLTFDVCVRHHQLSEVVGLVRRCPETRFVLDHLGKPDVAAGGQAAWARELERLAAAPNVSCKLSGLTSEADDHTRDDATLGDYLGRALDLFGPQRCLFGSDWPVSARTTTYTRWWRAVDAALTGLPDAERGAVLGGNAEVLYAGRLAR